MNSIIKLYGPDRVTRIGTLELKGDPESGWVGSYLSAAEPGSIPAVRLFEPGASTSKIVTWAEEYGADESQIARLLREIGGRPVSQQEANARWRGTMRASGHREIRRWVPDTPRTLGVMDALCDRLREVYRDDQTAYEFLLDSLSSLTDAIKRAG